MDKMKPAAESAQAQTSKIGVGASGDQMALANRGKRLMDAGVDTPAHLDSMTPTGNTDKPGGAENTIVATIKPEGGEEYQTTFNQYIYPSAPFAAGEDVTVRVDPADPGSVMIWGKG
ncbi:MAG: hypothetical protein ACR2OC_10550 [Solirubrobacterales bacterium]